MADQALSRIGQRGSSGASDALFIKLGIAELLDAFDRKTVFKDRVKTRSIKGAKSALFPVSGRSVAAYHNPVKPILGATNPNDRNDREIALDGLLIADKTIYNTDEMKAYYEIRQDITHQLGEALAREYDARAARVIFAAAATDTEPLGQSVNANRTGQTQTLASSYNTATAKAKGDALIDAATKLKISMQKKDVPTDDLWLAVGPEEYDALLESTRGINADWNQGSPNGTFKSGMIMKMKGLNIIMSNHVTQANYTKNAYDNNTAYVQNLSKCVALLFHRDCMGVLTLKAPTLQVTPKGSTYEIMYQSTLMVASMNIGMGVLRAECAGSISKA